MKSLNNRRKIGNINNDKLTMICSFLSLEQLIPGIHHPANSTWENDILLFLYTL